MSFLNKLRNRLLGKPATADYRPFHHYHFRQPRDLPRFSFEIIRHMLMDPTVRLGLSMRAAPICQAEIAHKTPTGWEPGVMADRRDVAEFLNRQVERLWTNDLPQILKAQIWGWSGGEVTYRLVDRRVEFDTLLRRLARDTIALVSDGEVQGVTIAGVTNEGRVDLLMPKAFWHGYDTEAGSPYGQSVLLGAYSSWADKWLEGGALDVRRLFMHKDAYGGVDIQYPPGTTNIDGKGEVPNRDIARELVEQLKAGGVTTRPSVFDPVASKQQWELTRATIPSTPTHILDYPKDLDTEILRGLGIPDDILISETTGAWQGKQVPMQAFFAMSEQWLSDILKMISSQIFEPLVLLNFGSAIGFEITAKPLSEQAMEQMKASQSSPMPSQPAPQQPAFQPQQQTQMGLIDANTTELLVGQGLVQASHLVEAGKRFMLNGLNGHRKRKPLRLSASTRVEQDRQAAIAEASRLYSLTQEERQLLENMTK